MLEDALKRDTSGQAKDVGWRRSSARDSGGSARSGTSDQRSSLERSQSIEYPLPSSTSSASVPPSPPSAQSPPQSSTPQDNRFFKFRFNNSAPNPASQPASRPGSLSGSPQIGHSGLSQSQQHLTSPSLPSLSSSRTKEVEDLEKELEKEKQARKKIADAKTALEEELESLSQALFEEANKMVATERKLRADAEEELNELKREKEALRSALVLVEGENTNLRLVSPQPASGPSSIGNSPQTSIGGSSTSFTRAHERSASQTAIKSRPASLDFSADPYPPLPPSPAPSSPDAQHSAPPVVSVLSPASADSSEFGDAQPTPRSRGPAALPEHVARPASVPPAQTVPPSVSSSAPGVGVGTVGAPGHHRSFSANSLGIGLELDEPSPWADVPSRSRAGSPEVRGTGAI
ncbi:hypothetical protein HYPSUDRAFT_39928 [Hypholoma sublateritium FD-334 SS-4]|uniref:GDP/GTP exchange factor Sec2 N-terminal domain-containing protein n=1 Tax=Hypholoma sublateritium (strain FD-334 SS-4) TaxID=945553 RepID=A0A0D2P445_HYPSF|nr:hypothetical protein HYPSUDRAFT_39928 [Hypholoma sublateritium FD-334 SS-4]